MVFNSFIFIGVFLPVVYAGFLAAHRFGGWPMAFRWLAIASLVFYGQWSLTLLTILVVSVGVNFVLGQLIARVSHDRQLAGFVLIGAIAANVLALGYFKYANFFLDIAAQLSGAGLAHVQLILPVGISFYTFVQIGYLIEAYNGQLDRHCFSRYVLFATFFPCVTAGPLVLQREMFDQMKERRDAAFNPYRLAAGLTMFGMGLFKKAVLADSIAPFADAVFGGVAAGHGLDPQTAWTGALCYALQLYFDFSGYSDMAVGLGCMFGINLPLNFDSPFKATNISDFWRRWHMTMTRFFTTYIFTPLAMARMRAAVTANTGKGRRYIETAAVPVIVTFLVAGVWHGAGWNFAVYGLIHGCAIAIYLGWRELELPKLPPLAGWAITMMVVVSALVVFRAPDFTVAWTILATMWTGPFGASAGDAAVAIDMTTANSLIVLLGAIVLLLPNTQQILHREWVSSDARSATAELAAGPVIWRPTFARSLLAAIGACIAIASINANSTFLYYQF